MRKLEYDIGDVVQVTEPDPNLFEALWGDPNDDHMFWFGMGRDALHYKDRVYVITSKSEGGVEGKPYFSYELGALSGHRDDRDNWYYWPAWMLRIAGDVEPAWEV